MAPAPTLIVIVEVAAKKRVIRLVLNGLLSLIYTFVDFCSGLNRHVYYHE